MFEVGGHVVQGEDVTVDVFIAEGVSLLSESLDLLGILLQALLKHLKPLLELAFRRLFVFVNEPSGDIKEGLELLGPLERGCVQANVFG